MFDLMKNYIAIFIFSMILSKNDNSNIEYIIYTSNDFYEQADIIKNL